MTSGITRRTPSTTGYSQGDVVLVSFPFTDLTAAKRRPAVVVSPDTFNQRNEDLVLAAITSQVVHHTTTVFLGKLDVVDGHLPKDSVIRLAKLFTVHSSLVVKRLCRLRREKRDELLLELQSFFRS